MTKRIARTATRVLHMQRDVDGRTHQVDVLARFDQKAQEYVITDAQRAHVELGLAAQVAREPASSVRVAFIRTALRETPASLAALLDVGVDNVEAWERGDAAVPSATWTALAVVVDQRAGDVVSASP